MKNREIRSFGRTKSRKLKGYKKDLLDNFLPEFLIENPKKTTDPKKYFPKKDRVFLEIGFGYGDFLYEQARKNPEAGYIGCEVYLNGIVNLLNKIQKNKIENIRIYNDDARILIRNLKNSSIDKAFILFPDPWPKRKHNKRRLINLEFLDTLFSKLKPQGAFYFVSDIEDYITWTLKQIENHGKFKSNFKNLEDCKIIPEWWTETKYQKKAIREGRGTTFLSFQKPADS